MAATLPELTIIDILNTIVDRVKQTRPARTDGKPLSSGLVYSQLVLGMPIDPRDYAKAWSPMGGATGGQATAGVPATATPGAPPPALLSSLEAAFKTAQLCNIMLQVTDDGSYEQYPVGRHLDFCYSGILSAMQPMPVPPTPPDVQAAIDAAQAVLYTMDTTDPANPVISGKSVLYSKYTKNAIAYAKAKSDYALAQASTLANPATGNMWPQLSAPYQETVDDAWNTWKTEGADKVEKALAVIESQGINMQQAQIAKAKKQMDIWSLGLAGVPTDIPYSYIEPSEWSNPDIDDIGFEQLVIKRTSETHAASTVTDSNHSMFWNKEEKSTTQSSHVSYMGIGKASEGSTNADQRAANGDASKYVMTTMKADHFTDFEVDLEWGLVTIFRPWLISDLFYMGNWYIQGEKANCVSDGKIETQLRSAGPLLPMIPQQMLVVRNVKISSGSWGDSANTLNSLYGGNAGSSDASQSSVNASAGVSFGPIGGGGGVKHTDNKSKADGSGYSAATATDNHGAEFDGTTLSIKGAQVIAFLSDIVPPSPALPDPDMDKDKPKAADNSFAGAPTGTTMAGTPVAAGGA